MLKKYNTKDITVVNSGGKRNEDSFSISKKENKIAIADGATRSWYPSNEWSEILVKNFSEKEFSRKNIFKTLEKLSKKWNEIIPNEIIPNKEITSRYDGLLEKEEKYAGATFLGITINKERETFNVIAIGDCTLFQVRNGKLIFSFPMKSSIDFSNSPKGFITNNKYQPDLNKYLLYENNIKIEKDDILILSTDAIANRIFKQVEYGRKRDISIENKKGKFKIGKFISKKLFKNSETLFFDYFIKKFSNNNKRDFKSFIKEKRNDKEEATKMKDDDTTLIVVYF